MARWVTIDEVADAAYAAGYKGEALAIAIAVTKPESGMGAPAGYWADAEAIGDTTLENATWGPSIGAWQVRTVKAERGKGTTRDRDKLYGNLLAQAAAAYSISGGNTTTGTWRINGRGSNSGWGHWSVFQQGKHNRYLADARAAAARREAIGGTGSISGGATVVRDPFGHVVSTTGGDSAGSGPAGGERSPDRGVTSAMELLPNIVPLTSVHGMQLKGSAELLNLGAFATTGTIDLSTDEASELSIELLNPDNIFVGAGRGTATPRGRIDIRGLAFTVSAIELGDAIGDGRVTLSCRDFYVDLLKRTNVDAAGKASGDQPRGVPVAGKNISPTEYADLQTAGNGILLRGEGSARRTDIAPAKGDDGIYESPWEVMNRLADELGYLCFVSGGILHFGRPSWLLQRATPVKVGLSRGAWGDEVYDTIGRPVWRESVDNFLGAELTVTLPRWRGEQVRPGMKLVTKGLYGLAYSEWLVHRVSWELDEGRSPVTVDAKAAVDPIVIARNGPPDADPTGPSTSSAPAVTGGTAVSPPGAAIDTATRRRLFGHETDTQRVTTYRTPWGINVQVNKAVLNRFRSACESAARLSSWKPKRIDGRVVRVIAGTNEMSLHSWALAWDFFATGPGVPPPGGVWTPDNPPDSAFYDAFSAQGFRLGRDFRRRKDLPHIEWASAPPPS